MQDDLNKSEVEFRSSGMDNRSADELAAYIRGQQEQPAPEPKPAEPEQSKEDTQDAQPQKEQPQEEQPAETDGGQDSSDEGFDPNKLPPELQDTYKKMQANFTPKLQEAAEFRKFKEQLEANPQEAIGELQKKYLKQEAKEQEKLTKFEQQLTPEQRTMFDEYIEKKTMNKIKQSVGPYIYKTLQNEEKSALTELSRRHGAKVVEQNYKQMQKLRQELPGLTLDEAFAIASYRNQPQVGTQTKKVERNKVYSESPSGGEIQEQQVDPSKMSAEELRKILPRKDTE